MKKLFALIIVLLLSCFYSHAIGAKSAMDSVLSSWVGYPVEDVIAAWGDYTYKKQFFGHKVFYWTSNISKIEGYLNESEQGTCTRILEMDENNIVIKFNWSGTDCPMNCGTGQKWINPKNNSCI